MLNGGMSELLEGLGGGRGGRGSTNDQMDDLWDDLHLGELLNGLQKENDALVKAKRAAAKVESCESITTHRSRIHFIKGPKWSKVRPTVS
jgi:hypothetical protein